VRVIRAWRAAGRRASSTDLAEIAALVHRLAVLLSAGVAPAAAWRHAAPGPLAPIASRVVDAAARDGPGVIPDAVAALARGDPGDAAPTSSGAAQLRSSAVARAWTGLAATWWVSAAAGAPLAPTLRVYAELLRGFAAAERDRRIALAGPRATSRLVLVLPAVAVAFGALLGQDTLGVLFGTPIGWACLGIGSALGIAGWGWTRALVRRATGAEPSPGLGEELTAVAMSGGVSVPRARELVGIAFSRYRLAGDRTRADSALALAAAAGAPAGELLRAEAEECRRTTIADAKERAERLSVTLMLPLGVCVLPAFVVVGVLPLMVAVVGSTLEVV